MLEAELIGDATDEGELNGPAVQDREHTHKRKNNGGLFEIRIGINSGPVIAGIVGSKKFAYDIWGDTVNTAARMEQNSEPGKINISESTYMLAKNDTYREIYQSFHGFWV